MPLLGAALALPPGCSSGGRIESRASALVAPPVSVSAPVGTIATGAGVDGAGQAWVDVAIEVPPGRAGMAPALALRYSSGSGDGQLGIGFALDGVSALTRCALDATHPARAVPGAVALCFEGSRLVLQSGTDGGDDAVYRVVDLPGYIVTAGRSEGGERSYTVHHPDGQRTQYGRYHDNKIWITARLDRDDNGIKYLWTEESDQLLLDQIRYTSTSKIGDGYAALEFAGTRAVHFEYELRPLRNRYRRYRVSPEWKGPDGLARQLTEIRTEVDGAVIRRYQLHYDEPSASGQTLLTSVEACDAAGVCLPPTVFTWALGEAGYEPMQVAAADTAPNFKDLASALSIDIDFDGKTELVYATGNYPQDPAADWVIWDPEEGTRTTGIPARTSPSAALAPQATDINGDGNPDLVSAYCSDAAGCVDTGVPHMEYRYADAVHVVFGTTAPAGLVQVAGAQTALTSADVDGHRMFITAAGEINGDGFPDLYVCAGPDAGHAKWFLALNRYEASGQFYEVVETQRLCSAYELYQVMDSDADGATELFVPKMHLPLRRAEAYTAKNGDGWIGAGEDHLRFMLSDSYVALEFPRYDENHDPIPEAAAIDMFMGGINDHYSKWPINHVQGAVLPIDFGSRILRYGCWNPDEEAVEEDLSVLQRITRFVKGDDADPEVPPNVPFVQAGPSPDFHVDLNDDGLVDILRLVAIDPADATPLTGANVGTVIYDQAQSTHPPVCRADQTFNYAFATYINQGRTSFDSDTLGGHFELTGHTPWVLTEELPYFAANVLGRSFITDYDGDGSVDLVMPDYDAFRDHGEGDRWKVIELSAGGMAALEVPDNSFTSLDDGERPLWYDTSMHLSPVLQEHYHQSADAPAIRQALANLYGLDIASAMSARVARVASTAVNLQDSRQADVLFFSAADGGTGVFAFGKAGDVPDLLTRVTDGLGAVVGEFTYASGRDASVYAPGLATGDPEHDRYYPRTLVSQFREDAGVRETATRLVRNYRYQTARYDRKGGGALGFAKIAIENRAHGAAAAHRSVQVLRDQATELVDGRFPFRGQVTDVITETHFQRDGLERRLISVTSNHFGSYDSDAPGIQGVVQTSGGARELDLHASDCVQTWCSKSEVAGASAFRSSQFSNSAVDAFGNVAHTHRVTGDGHHTVIDRETDNYTDPAVLWQLGALRSETVTRTLPDGTSDTTHETLDFDPATGRLVRSVREPKSTDPELWLETAYVHDNRGNLRQVVRTSLDGTARAETHGYDDLGYFRDETQSDGVAWKETFIHDPGTGKPLVHTHPSGNVHTVTCIDGFGRETCRRTEGLGGATAGDDLEHTYSAVAGDPDVVFRITTERAGIEISRVELDRLQRERRRFWWVLDYEGPDHVATEWKRITDFDHRRRKSFESVPLATDASAAGAPGTHWHHDDADRVIQVQRPQGTEHLAYTQLETSRLDAEGHTTAQVENQLGRVVRTVSGNGVHTCFGWDPLGNLAQVTRNCTDGGAPPNGDPSLASTFDHDLAGRLTTLSDPELGSRSFDYNAFGDVAQAVDGEGVAITYTYDALGRPSSRTASDHVATWNWDVAFNGEGQLHSQILMDLTTGDTVVRASTYDVWTRQASETIDVAGQTFQFLYEYDNTNQLETVEYPQVELPLVGLTPFRVRYEHTAWGHLHRAVDDLNGALLWEARSMDGYGQLAEESFGNGYQSRRDHDPATGRLASIVTRDAGGGIAQNWSYEWSPGGNLRGRYDGTTDRRRCYRYDAGDQLLDVIDQLGPSCGEGLGLLDASISYDALGRIVDKSGVGGYTYDPASGRLVSVADDAFAYDDNGQLEVRTSPAGNVEVTWGSWGKPRQMVTPDDTISMLYDAAGTQVRKQTASGRTLHSLGLFTRIDAPYPAPTEYRYTVMAGGRAVAEVARIGLAKKTRYFHGDFQGTPTEVSDQTGAVSHRRYDPWGREQDWSLDTPVAQPWAATTSEPTTIGYTGHDSELVGGMINMRARYYDPRLGRFMSADTVVPEPGRGIDWERYAYVRNNPLRWIDPSGHAPAGGGDGGGTFGGESDDGEKGADGENLCVDSALAEVQQMCGAAGEPVDGENPLGHVTTSGTTDPGGSGTGEPTAEGQAPEMCGQETCRDAEINYIADHISPRCVEDWTSCTAQEEKLIGHLEDEYDYDVRALPAGPTITVRDPITAYLSFVGDAWIFVHWDVPKATARAANRVLAPVADIDRNGTVGDEAIIVVGGGVANAVGGLWGGIAGTAIGLLGNDLIDRYVEPDPEP